MDADATAPAQYLLTPMLPSSSDLAPLNVIRTETVLSKLPIHTLAKKGYVEINILRRNDSGQIDLRWEVSYSNKFGPPRQLAYKLDTLVINRRIDEQRRPLPKVLKLGSLSQICSALDMPSSGQNTNNVKRAILQNAGSLISAKLTYNSVDGAQRRLEAIFTRYSVVFTGERLPNGKEADGVYLIFNEPYWEVLNNAPVRPLDYDYLKLLSPAPQRFYEILSYRMFVALKYEHPHARLAYSEYCTFSAQQRYYDYDRFKKQMYKVHIPHLRSRYIAKVTYEAAVDSEGRPDWIMYYQPGAKAKAEYTLFERGPLSITAEKIDEPLPGARNSFTPDESLVAELMARGISSAQSRKLALLAGMGQPVLQQLEWGDHLIRQAGPRKFYNPPGFYVYLIRENIAPPRGFARSRTPAAQPAQHDANLECELAYEEYRRGEVDRYLKDEEHQSEFRQLVSAKQKGLLEQYRSLASCSRGMVRELAESAARSELARRLPVRSFAAFAKGYTPEA